ncbi:MAG TPA: LacI family DNA-binding transcriptional regulator [Rhodothermales bacterium]
MTIRDVAMVAGVSSATVSNVINEKGKVSDSTRRAVLKVVEELNYRPSQSAQKRYRTGDKCIGVIVKELKNPYFSDVILGAQEAADAAGYQITIATSEGHRDKEDRIVDLFTSQDVGGLIVYPLFDSETDLTHLFNLKRRNIPLVLLERVRGLRASRVDVDNHAACRDVVQYLLGLGHERIIHLAGPEYSMHGDERAEGFRQAFFDSHLVFRPEYIVRSGARLEEGYRAGRAYFRSLKAKEAPTAVFCYNDFVAIGLMRALRELGIRVPDDISIIGFDDIDLCEYVNVPLTTMRVPRSKIGASAVEMLIRQMESGGNYVIEHETHQAQLVRRASTAPLN